MRTIAVFALAAVSLFGSPALAFAQEEEEEEAEEGGDIDSLMASDPEQAPKKEEGEDAEEDAERPPADSEDASGEPMTDDERPPGDEPAAEPEPAVAEVEEDTSGDHPNPLSIGVLVGGGFALEGTGNPWGLGFGLRGGYNVGGFYIGGRFAYFLGETITVLRPVFATGMTREEEQTLNLWELGGEVGYDLRAGDAVFRPELGVGFASVSRQSTQASVFIAPGLALIYEVSPTFFLGIDGRYQFIATELGDSGITVLGNVGMRF